jgi:hypothetical protein
LESLARNTPQLVVIHRDAFTGGPWFGAEEAAGGTMLEEIGLILPWAVEREVPVIFVDNGTADQLHTGRLREIGSLFFPSAEFFQRLPEKPRRSAIYELAEKFGNHAEEN